MHEQPRQNEFAQDHANAGLPWTTAGLIADVTAVLRHTCRKPQLLCCVYLSMIGHACQMQAEVAKLEEEAAGIALATKEEYTQYQQLKQVSCLLKKHLSSPSGLVCKQLLLGHVVMPYHHATCQTAQA